MINATIEETVRRLGYNVPNMEQIQQTDAMTAFVNRKDGLNRFAIIGV